MAHKSYKMLDGFPMPAPAFFSEENLVLMRDLPLREGDVIIDTYPKCGTNWAAFIVWSLRHPNEEPPEGSKLFTDYTPFVEFGGLGPFGGSYEGPRTLVTHLPSGVVSDSPKAKYVIVARNPLDTVVSSYHFFNSFSIAKDSSDGKVPDEHFESFMSGLIAYGDIFAHIKGWYNRRNESNIHFVTYEELKKDRRGEILKIAKFLGVEKPLEENNEKILDKIVEQTSFDYMKVKYESLQHGGKKVNMIRRGKVGGFNDDLTEEQIQRLKDKMKTELEGTELLKQWLEI